MDSEAKIEPIICPLWESRDRRFRSRHYHSWDRPCSLCSRKVVVSTAVMRQIASDITALIVCEQCAYVEMPVPNVSADHDRKLSGQVAVCETCTMLKEQEQAAAKEWSRFANFQDEQAKAAYRKWAHLSAARAQHRKKAHADDPRGRH